MHLPDDYPEQLADLAGVLFERLRKRDIPHADEIAKEQTEDVRAALGGGLLYIPKGTRYANRLRNEEIWHEHVRKGVTPPQLSQRYGLNIVTIYEILAAERAKQQPALF
ncbi:MAG: hypothetical protein KDJ54_19580 [Candidatus Competibacteraceae bacterium]|nr:hypothetical protein [Candidatus Competibacteraceae bacterium]